MDAATPVSAIRALTARRPVQLAFLAGLTAMLLLRVIDNPLTPLARGLLAWDVGITIYLACTFWLLHDATPEVMARHAARARVGRHFALAISIASVVISIAVIALELRLINAAPDGFEGLRLGFVVATVTLTWLFVHTSFATHYAFEYYGRDPGAAARRGGLVFACGKDPDFWDVWHFSIVIALTSATADINIASRGIRRIVTMQGITAFLFNTIILAATINFAGQFLNPAN
jgi:uncharacterized membrane protein